MGECCFICVICGAHIADGLSWCYRVWCVEVCQAIRDTCCYCCCYCTCPECGVTYYHGKDGDPPRQVMR